MTRRAGPGRRWLQRGLWGLAGLLALALVVVSAWVVSNLGDAAPQGVSERLRLPPSTLAPADNAFFTLQALMAGPGEDAAAEGRAAWDEQQAFNRLGRAEVLAGASRAPHASAEHTAPTPTPARLQPPRAAPWACGDALVDCAAQQLAAAEVLAQQQALAAPWGERCDRIVDTGQGYEEQLPDPLKPWSALPAFQHLTSCAHWFAASAVLAAAQDDAAAAEAALLRGAIYSQRILEGSRSLAGHLVALRVQQRHLNTLATLAARDGALAQAALPMLAQAPDLAAAARRAIAFEAAFGRAAFADLQEECTQAAQPTPPAAGVAMHDASWGQRWRSRAEQSLCGRGIGFHLHRTQQVAETRWLQLLDALGQGWPAAIAAGDLRHDGGPHWRNTLGMMMLDVASGYYGVYLRRFADAELLHQVVTLGLQATVQGVPAAERGAWMARQTLPAAQRARLSLQPDGRVLTARPWAADAPSSRFVAKTDGIRVYWDW